MKVTLSSFKRFFILNLKDSSFLILNSSFKKILHSAFEDSSSVETLNPISDDDDDYSKKNRPLPVRSKRGVSIFYLYIYNINIIYI